MNKLTIIKNLIKTTFPNKKFEFIMETDSADGETELMLVKFNPTNELTKKIYVKPNDTWKNIKERIIKVPTKFDKKRFTCQGCKKCPIQEITGVKKFTVKLFPCPECKKEFCINCYKENLTNNWGYFYCKTYNKKIKVIDLEETKKYLLENFPVNIAKSILYNQLSPE
jgi:hypothetical protein